MKRHACAFVLGSLLCLVLSSFQLLADEADTETGVALDIKDELLKIALRAGYSISLSVSGQGKGLIHDGPFTLLYPSGELYMKGVFKNGQLSGSATTYFKSGKISAVCAYLDGELEGSTVEYYETGLVHCIYTYVSGKRNGAQIVFDEIGNISLIFSLLNGKVISYTEFDKGLLKRHETGEKAEEVARDFAMRSYKMMMNK